MECFLREKFIVSFAEIVREKFEMQIKDIKMFGNDVKENSVCAIR